MPEVTEPDDGEAGDDPPDDGDVHGGDGDDGDDGVQMNLISGERMEGMASMEKIHLILDEVRDGNIVILEAGLTPQEESKLIEVTMAEISPDEFDGIEIESYPQDAATDPGLFGRLVGETSSQKLTVIGPANRIETLHKDETLIRTLVSQ
jgi:hypothetical protein